MRMRDRLAHIARAASDTAATHALLMWLDTLPPEVLIAAEGRRRAGMVGDVTRLLPTYRVPNDHNSTVELQVDTDEHLARFYWEHPSMIWSGREFGG